MRTPTSFRRLVVVAAAVAITTTLVGFAIPALSGAQSSTLPAPEGCSQFFSPMPTSGCNQYNSTPDTSTGYPAAGCPPSVSSPVCNWAAVPPADPANPFYSFYNSGDDELHAYWAAEKRPDIWDDRNPADPQKSWEPNTWSEHARSEGLSVDGNPVPGDIAVIPGYPVQVDGAAYDGELGYVEAVTSDGVVLSWWFASGYTAPYGRTQLFSTSGIQFVHMPPPGYVPPLGSPANPFPPPAAALSSSLSASGTTASIGAILKAGGYVASVSAGSPGSLQIVWYFVPVGAHIASAKPIVVASGSKWFGKAGSAKLKLKLTAAGRAMLKKAKQLKLTAVGSFKPKHGKTITKRKAIKLKR